VPDQSLDNFVQGTSQLGGLYTAVDDETAYGALETAWSLGVRHFDTAPHYGAGLSERRVGAFLSQFPRDSYTLSTKVGRLLVPAEGDLHDPYFVGGDSNIRVFDFSRDGILRSFQDSLQRLGLDRIDTLYLHDPDDHLDQAIAEAYPALAKLRDEGLISKVGAGMSNAPALERIVRETTVDEIMLAGRYTLMDRSAADSLLPICLEKKVNVVAVGVYGSGLLADPKPGAYYDYRAATDDEIDTAVDFRDAFAQHGIPLQAAAIQFPLQHPAISSVGIGARNATQSKGNVDFFNWNIPSALWRELKAPASIRNSRGIGDM
jgi:aryl-alcohol dehydrogenase-like predicted oxidoreductase